MTRRVAAMKAGTSMSKVPAVCLLQANPAAEAGGILGVTARLKPGPFKTKDPLRQCPAAAALEIGWEIWSAASRPKYVW